MVREVMKVSLASEGSCPVLACEHVHQQRSNQSTLEANAHFFFWGCDLFSTAVTMLHTALTHCTQQSLFAQHR